MMLGTHVVRVGESKASTGEVCVDGSAYFADGDEIAVVRLWEEESGCVGLWRKGKMPAEVARLEAELSDEEKPPEVAYLRGLLESFRSASIAQVDGGVLCLAAGLLVELGIVVGDKCVVLGCGDHAELWSWQRWDAESQRSYAELSASLDEFCAELTCADEVS